MRTKVSDYVMARMAEEGLEHAFFLPGGGCMHLVDSLRREPRLTPILCLHEQAAAIAADACSQYTGHPGMALVTAGPGSTNAITGVAASWIDSIPVVVISGQAKTTEMIADWHVRQMGVQEVDIVSMVGAITKYAVTVRDPIRIRYEVEKALFLCRDGRPGPVWLDIPLDVQGAQVEVDELEAFVPEPHRDDAALVAHWVDEAAGLLAGARRPVVLVGNGVRLSGALGEFRDWVRQAGLPVLTTWKSADFFADDDPLFAGRPGSIGQRGANFAVQNADVLLVIGARLDLPSVGFEHAGFAPLARKVVVDVDEPEIAKHGESVNVAAATDAGRFVRALAARGVEWRDMEGWLDRCRAWKLKYPPVTAAARSATGLVDTYALIDVLSDELRPDDVLVPGSSGSCAEITMQAFRVKDGQRVLNSPGLGSMGFGLPAAIGAAQASGRRVAAVVGDGGLQLNIQELETMRRLGLPIKLFVLNNGGYASIRASFGRHFGELIACDPPSGLTLPDTLAVARAYGLPAFRVDDNPGLTEGVRQVLAQDGPVVCELMVDPALETQPRLASSLGTDGRMTSRPLEDLWPFLSAAELADNMLG